MKDKDRINRAKASTMLTHAMWHCQFGSDTWIRIPDEGDLAAKGILLECRQAIERENIERDIIEGRT